jgi:mitochondrial fission protein ELM1
MAKFDLIVLPYHDNMTLAMFLVITTIAKVLLAATHSVFIRRHEIGIDGL